MGIPQSLEAIILRAMHVNPSERFGSVHALGQALWSFASSRGQVEWKNYYFNTPPASALDEATLRGIPHAPVPGASGISLPEGVPVARVTVEPTAVLADSVNVAPEVSPAASPQLFLSTKVAKPTPPTGPETPAPAEEPEGGRSWRRWAAFGVAAGVLSAGLGMGYRHLGATTAAPVSPPVSTATGESASKHAPSTASSVAPATAPSVATVSKLVPTRAATIEPARTPNPEPSAAALATSSPKARKKRPTVRQIHAPQTDQSPKLTGLDKNGIGIPTN